MAALPLQGMAAASMLFCGSQAAAHVGQAAGHPAPKDMSGHDHAAHGHGADHGAHEQPAAQVGAGEAASHSPDASGAASPSHSCPICASCSQSQAVGGFDSLPLAAPAPSAEPSQPPVRVTSRTLTLPDKPPRA